MADREPSLTEVLADWAAGLRYETLPPRVAERAVSQVISHLGVLRAGMAHPLGAKLIAAFGDPLSADPAAASCVLAGLSSCLYYEDSLYLGHVTHAAVNVAIAYGSALRLDGRRVIAAVVAAGECAARVTAAAALGPLRGQGATYTHLVGAVAARLHAESAPARRWVDAWGIALAAPPWPLRRAFYGSDAKVLSAAGPVRTGLDACAAATAGLGGAPDILEHPGGLLAKFAGVPLPQAVTMGLSERWHTDTTTVKLHPAGAYVDAAIDCAVELHERFGPVRVADVVEIVVHSARLTMTMDAEGAPYLDGGDSAIMALNISVGYNVATALLTGAVRPADLARPATADPLRWRLADLVRLVYEPALSRALMRATAPLGEAVRHAGERAREWFADFSGGRVSPDLAGPAGPSRTFADATKAVGSRVLVRLRDGRELVAERSAAAGSAGAVTRRDHRALAMAKLRSTGAAPAVAADGDRLAELNATEVDELIRAALQR